MASAGLALGSGGLAHSSSSPSFHTFSSSSNALNNHATFSNSIMNNGSKNPLAPHNFPALTTPSYAGSSSLSATVAPPTTLHYSAALNPRPTTPSIAAAASTHTAGASTPPVVHPTSPDRHLRAPSPEQPAVSTFQVAFF